MKRISLFLAMLLAVPLFARAQDAATEEQLNKLRGEITALQSSNVELQKRLSEVLKELQELREQTSKPAGNYAAAEDVKRLADAIKEVDRKREADRELILDELKKLAKAGGENSGRRPTRTPEDSGAGGGGTRSAGPEKGYDYVVQSGDTLSTVVAEYRKQGVKVTVDQVLKANPNLKPSSLKVGQKIFIPASAVSASAP
jgi:LysM repeat protein